MKIEKGTQAKVNVNEATKQDLRLPNGFGKMFMVVVIMLAINEKNRVDPATPFAVGWKSTNAKAVDATNEAANFTADVFALKRKRINDPIATISGNNAPKTSIPKDDDSTTVARTGLVLK